MLQRDPALEDVGLVIFDEFHERSIHADLGSRADPPDRAVLREDLRILVMSATLEGGPVSGLLGGAPIVTSEGRSFPVEVRHLAPRARSPARAHRGGRGAARAGRRTRATSWSSCPEPARSAESRRLLTTAWPSSDAAAWEPAAGSAGPRHSPESAGLAKGRARHLDRRDQPHDRGRPRGGGQPVWPAVPRYSPRTGMTRLATIGSPARPPNSGGVAPAASRQASATGSGRARRMRRCPSELLPRSSRPTSRRWRSTSPPRASAIRSTSGWLDPPPAAAFSEARSSARPARRARSTPAVSPAHGSAMAGLGAASAPLSHGDDGPASWAPGTRRVSWRRC